MVELTTKGIMKRDYTLSNQFKNKGFNHKRSTDDLNEGNGRIICLGDLKKCGWLEVNLDLNDCRIDFISVKNPNNAVREMMRW